MKIRITPGALLLLLVLAATRSALLLPTLLAALVHESGHLIAAARLRIPLRLLELDLPGARILPSAPLPSYRAEALLALGGPAASLLLALALSPRLGGFAVATRAAALSQAAFNLLPVRGFDGGRALGAALAARLSPIAVERCTAVLSYLSLLFLFSLASCLVLRFGASFPLAVLSATLFAKLFLL